MDNWNVGPSGQVAAEAAEAERVAFIRRTYAHLAGAIALFVALERVYFATGIAETIASYALSPRSFRYGWLLVMGAFIGVAYLAEKMARSDRPRPMQYAALAVYAVAESLIFVPLLYIAAYYATPDVLPTAAITTLVLFGGLTAVVFMTKKDFTFLRGILSVVAIGGLATIVCSIVFGFSLGNVFCGIMLMLAAGYVLYDTSQVMLHYRTDQHVSAALKLFASIALMFWYVLRILLNTRR